MSLHLRSLIQGQAGNHMLPFLWMHAGVGVDGVRAQVRAARQSGAREVCVESRPHEHFCEDEWWRDMDALLDEAQKLDMRVWILDDKHFPTGYANGLIPKKYPQRRKWQLAEWSVDVVGPMKDASIFAYSPSAEHEESIVSIAAYRRVPGGEGIEGPCVDLAGRAQSGYLYWDVPEGAWRVFFCVKTRRGTKQTDYIHLIDPQSVEALIEAVYEPHYQHYGHLFGNTIAGFFSDEPSFGNEKIDWYHGPRPSMYENTVGQLGLALPWTDDILRRMTQALGRDAKNELPKLWYECPGQEEVRLAYMNAVTLAWRDAFSRQLGDWCRQRGVMYIGHIIEDMNAHARLSCSGGHYFRSLEGQDMSGIDVVLHQIMPGMSQFGHSAICFGSSVDGHFFDYVLAKLGASAAHLEPRKRGRAMCEIFGAYGWAEGSPFMKYLMDHMLVRGINRFVPHAFSPAFPDPDCPPHFFGDGGNPQFPGFARIMDYGNFTADILEGAAHVAPAAVLYHAEAEWSGRKRQLTQAPAKALYDAQIDFDIVPLDMLAEADVENGRLTINGVSFQALVVPGCEYLPEGCLDRLAQAGVPILFTDFKPHDMPGEALPLSQLPGRFQRDIVVSPEFPLLRAYHARRDGRDVYMFVNESVSHAFDGTVRLSARGEYAYLQKQLEYFASGETEDGVVPLLLAPGEAALLVFGSRENLPPRQRARLGDALAPVWRVSRARIPALPPEPSTDPAVQQSQAAVFEPVYEGAELPNMTGPAAPGDPNFSGLFRYEAEIDLTGAEGIDLGCVGQTARLLVNGQDCGLRFCAPYRFDLRPLGLSGKARVVVEVANTLAHAHRDPFSAYMQIPPSGLTGPVRMVKYE